MINKIIIFLILLASSTGPKAQSIAESTPNSSQATSFKDPLENWQRPDDARFDPQDLGKDLQISWDILEEQFKKSVLLRKEFHDLQQKYISKFKTLQNKPNSNYIKLSKDFSQALAQWLSDKINGIIRDDDMKKEMAIVAFGSLARLEAGPVTDLEVALIWNDSYKDKETRDRISFSFANQMARTFEGLIGHPLFGLKGFRLDEENASPFHLTPWAQNLSLKDAYCWAAQSLPSRGETEEQREFKHKFFYPFEGTWAYTSTPKGLAGLTNYVYQNPEEKKELLAQTSSIFLNKKYILSQLKQCKDINLDTPQLKTLADRIYNRLMRNEKSVASFFRFIQRNFRLLNGDENVFKQFEEDIKTILDSPYTAGMPYRQKIARDGFRSLIRDFQLVGNGMFISGELPDVTDLKRYHYRLEEQVLTNLSLYYDLGVQNAYEIIKALREKSLIGEKFAKDLYERLNEITRLRWKEQIAIGEQLKTNYNFLTLKAYEENLTILNEKIADADEIINDKNSPKIANTLAKQNKSDAQSLLRVMKKLKPLGEDSVFDATEISLLKNKIIPGEVDLIKRIKSFLGSDKRKPNPNAFQDKEDIKE